MIYLQPNVHVIVVVLLETKDGNKYILVVIDHYSKQVEEKVVNNHGIAKKHISSFILWGYLPFCSAKVCVDKQHKSIANRVWHALQELWHHPPMPIVAMYAMVCPNAWLKLYKMSSQILYVIFQNVI